MKILSKLIVFFVLILPSTSGFSQDAINVMLVPDPLYDAHHIGVQMAITQNSKLGILATYKKDTDRPTYGDDNIDVTNTFNRVLIPWTYSFNGVWENGFFVTGLVGLEKSKFKSRLGSQADVTFVDLGLLAGYQWFWSNGFNISVMAGGAHLIESSLNKNISGSESTSVINYLDKNTKTNTHFANGVILGWVF